MTPEISGTVLVGVAVAGLAWLAGGLALLTVGRARLTAALLAAAGVSMMAGTVLSADDRDAAAGSRSWRPGVCWCRSPSRRTPCCAGGTRSTSSRSW